MMEAMALGVPTLAFDCPSGPRELSREGTDAMLVPCQDVPALEKALARMMESTSERERLGKAGLSVRDRFKLEKILAQWDELL